MSNYKDYNDKFETGGNFFKLNVLKINQFLAAAACQRSRTSQDECVSISAGKYEAVWPSGGTL